MARDVDPRRQRLVGLLVLGIAVVLLISTTSWFASGREAIGVAQLVVGLLLAAVGGVLVGRSRAG